jgi:hypothetical protein
MARRYTEVVVLNPSKDHSMKHRRFSNPDSLAGVAKDSGMALAAGAVAAAGAGLAMVASSKIDYAASTPAADVAMYRTGVAVGGVALIGALMQYSGNAKVNGIGKAMLVAAVAIPGSIFVAAKVSGAMADAPAQPLPAPALAPSQGMYGGLMGARAPYLNPAGFAADNYAYAPAGDLSSSIVSPTYIPPAR